MTNPTREAVEEMLNDFEAHELIGSRRDVYEFVVRVFKEYLAQEEELAWIRKKLKLPDDAESSAVYGAMHCLENYAREGSKWLPVTIKQRDEEREKVSQLEAENQALKPQWKLATSSGRRSIFKN